MSQIITEKHNKTLNDTTNSVQHNLKIIEFTTKIPHLLKNKHTEDINTNINSHTTQQPINIYIKITPFNFPIMYPL